jgi:hypothetical protein
MTSSTDPLGLRQHDPVERWRSQVERDEREAERQRRREEHRERRDALVNEAAERRQLEARIAALEASHHELQRQVVEVTRAAAEAIEVLAQTRDDIERELKAMLSKLETRITEIHERGAQEAKRTYEFARERIGKLTDLPNAMAPPRRVN